MQHTKKYQKVCKLCGKEFMTARNNAIFCSKYCQKAYRHKIKYIPKETTYDYIIKTCEYCGQDFQCESYKSTKKFCSIECRQDYYKYCRQQGINHKDELA